MADEYIHVTCGNCDKRYRVKNPVTFKRYRCKNCNGIIVVNHISTLTMDVPAISKQPVQEKEPLGIKYIRLNKEWEGRKKENKALFIKDFRSYRKPNRGLIEQMAHSREIGRIDGIFASRNNKGIAYEKKGEIEKAIKQYEMNVADEVDGTHSYDRLAIIYRRRKQYEDEIRIIKKEIEVLLRANKERAERFEKLRREDGRERNWSTYPIDKYKKRLVKAEMLKQKSLNTKSTTKYKNVK